METGIQARFLNRMIRERCMARRSDSLQANHAGLKAARKAMFAGVVWQRCQFHLQHNAQGYVSKLDSRVPVARTIRSIFKAPDMNEANR